jgi:hypothetical protein
LPAVNPPHVSGAIVLDQLKVAEELLGKDATGRALASMPAAAREEVAALLPVSWCTLTTADAIHEAMAREAREPVDEWHRKMVRTGMERTFSTIWRFFLRLTSIEQITKRAATMYGKSFDHGHMRAERVGPGHIVMTLAGWPDVPDRELAAIEVSTEIVIRLSGRTRGTVRMTRTPDGARFDVRTDDEPATPK